MANRAAFLAVILVLACVQAGMATQARLSELHQGWFSGLSIAVDLPGPVPYRVIPVDEPPRMVIDLGVPDIDASSISGSTAPSVADFRGGPLTDGWSRLVFDLATPILLEAANFQSEAGKTRLSLRFRAADEAEFARRARNAAAVASPRVPSHAITRTARKRIVLDPGHGGVDPGAIRQGVVEKDVALAFARDLARVLESSGRYDVELTRDADRFLTLGQRVSIARRMEPAVFISLHANTVTQGDASGAVVYVLSDVASDPASAARASLENRADVSAGLPAGELGDDISALLMDLERSGTGARSQLAAEHIVAELRARGQAITGRPLRSANFRVLRAPDMPSLLLEVGFLSSATDRRRMMSETWRKAMAQSILTALEAWDAADAELISLMRD